MHQVPYDGYAELYDRSGQARFSLRMVTYARELWELEGARVERVLELACGTGAAAVALARRGYEVTGVDRSEAMLRHARDRAQRWQAPVRWLCQDLRGLDAGGNFDAATCFYDSVNYFLVPEELTRVLAQIHGQLAPGGLLLFDAITDHGIGTVWGSETEIKLDADLVRIWKSGYDAIHQVGSLETVYFVREPDDRYRRISELHRHRGYSRFDVEEALGLAGFELRACYPCLTLNPVLPTTYRVAYLARAR